MTEIRKGDFSIWGADITLQVNDESTQECVQEESTKTTPTIANNNIDIHRRPRQSTVLSAIFLSLLPLPAAAYPQSRNKGSRRDRKRSGGDFTTVGRRGEGYDVTESAPNFRIEAEWKGEGQYQTLGDGSEEWDKIGVVDGNVHYGRDGEERLIQTSEQTSDPLPTPTIYRREAASETSTAAATSTTFPIPVPVTVLPYKVTRNSDGVWTTVDQGWTLYGRASVKPTHNALANADDGDGDVYDITTALPARWGQDSVRGNLYAVPLIVVASVCMALLFIVFIVVVVISRAKGKRKVERRKRRDAAREKRERRERKLAARAIATADGAERDVAQGERRPSAPSVMTVSTRRRSRGRFDSASSITDSEDDQDGDATPRVSGSSSTLRQAKLAATAAAVDSILAQQQNVASTASTAGRAGKAKKRFGWTSAVHAGTANSAAAGGVGTARLGDPRRVWGWKKGLRRRGNRAASAGRTRSRETAADVSTDDSETDEVAAARSTAVELSQAPSAELPLSTTAISPVNHVSEVAPDTEAPQSTVTGENGGPLASPTSPIETTHHQLQGPSVSAFPPAYYQAPAATSNAPSSPNGRVTNVGPSARAMEKRAMPAGPEYDDYFPAPTTEEQEQAVDIAYNRNLGLAQYSGGDTLVGGSALHPLVGQTIGMEVVPAGSAGHVATDDKQVLERLRMSGSAPTSGDGGENGMDASVTHGDLQQSLTLPTTTSQQSNGHHAVPLQASAPELPVDEDGFERLEDDLLPPDVYSHTNGTATTSRSDTTNAFPLPPAPIAQHSLAYAQPSAPLGMHPSSPSSSGFAGIPSAPSAPFDSPEHEEAGARPPGSPGVAVPSAPPLFDDEETNDVNMPVSSKATTLGDLEGSEMSVNVNQVINASRPSAPSRRFTIPHRTLGIDLPADLAATSTTTTEMVPPVNAPPAFSNPESSSPVSLQVDERTGSAAGSVAHVRYLPRYEP
ncbi:hypothetical protein QFC22_006664 [Naganishia vaughanmartiniae]|uniref:Uncharacterized protein n=1 Tax=Naganishia vaughanmartiniae TaxID=1424756 RepID=A0ACC2WHC1_9TREE|nr:hypothetical protein QFC22_006664 [Naganishia vaughanmartiniae]